MRLVTGNKDKVNKGAPSGFLISIILHAVAFFIAGIFVVFQVLPKQEPVFEPPPPVKRPKMKLKKPKVKVKKSSSPKPSSRIVAKVKTAKMPEIQIPDLVGTGTGLMGGTGLGGEFLEMPKIEEIKVFGGEVSTGNDLVGTFIDFKRARNGSNRPINADPYLCPNDVDIAVQKFMNEGWKSSSFARYYRSPNKLYTSAICIGTVQSTLAPEAFGENDTDGYAWVVLYEGTLVYPEDIKFRFRGVGDKFMAVRVGEEVVLLCAYNNEVREYLSDIWHANSGESRTYPMAEGRQAVGDWIELKAGEPKNLKILLGDRHGGLVYHQLVVEVEGEEYEDNRYGGGPRLPVFKTDNLSRAQVDALYMDTYPGDVVLTNGPVFCDVPTGPISYAAPIVSNVQPVFAKQDSKKLRTWTNSKGDSMEANLLSMMGDYIILETPDREQKRIPIEQLSDEDRRYAELAKPPEFRIEISKRSDQISLTTLGPYDFGRPLAIFDYNFGAKIKKYSIGEYNHKVTIEYFAIGGEINGDNYILLDRGKDSYTPTKENDYSHEFHGNKIRLRKYTNRASAPMRGTKYDGYLVTATDEEGRIIQYETSNEFLFKNLERLKQLPIRAHFDKNCVRTFPPRLIDADRGPGASL